MFVLAATAGYQFWLPLLVAVIAICVTLYVARSQRDMQKSQAEQTKSLAALADAVRRYERMEDKSERDLNQVKKDLHDANVKLIDERFRGMTHELRNEMNGLVMAANETKERLKEVDGVAVGLNERDHKLELAVEKKVDSLKDYIRENTASKNDVQRHEQSVDRKFNEVGREINQMGKQVAVLADQVKRQDLRRDE